MTISPQLDTHENFARFLKTPNSKTFRKLLRGNLGEFDFLDFKEIWPEKSTIAKSILAFANSGTGCLVIGVAEKEDKTHEAKGLSVLKDKTEIMDFLQKFIPKTVDYNIFDFEYDDSEYQYIKNKKFQLLWVVHNDESVPALSLADGDSIGRGRIYVRHNNSTREADDDQVQELIDKRIRKSMQTPRNRKLEDHLLDLKTLYIERSLFMSQIPFSSIREFGEFGEFLNKMIGIKQSKIEKFLDPFQSSN